MVPCPEHPGAPQGPVRAESPAQELYNTHTGHHSFCKLKFAFSIALELKAGVPRSRIAWGHQLAGMGCYSTLGVPQAWRLTLRGHWAPLALYLRDLSTTYSQEPSGASCALRKRRKNGAIIRAGGQ